MIHSMQHAISLQNIENPTISFPHLIIHHTAQSPTQSRYCQPDPSWIALTRERLSDDSTAPLWHHMTRNRQSTYFGLHHHLRWFIIFICVFNTQPFSPALDCLSRIATRPLVCLTRLTLPSWDRLNLLSSRQLQSFHDKCVCISTELIAVLLYICRHVHLIILSFHYSTLSLIYDCDWDVGITLATLRSSTLVSSSTYTTA